MSDMISKSAESLALIAYCRAELPEAARFYCGILNCLQEEGVAASDDLADLFRAASEEFAALANHVTRSSADIPEGQ